MKKFALFLALFGAAYLIYNFFAYFSGVRNLTSLIFGVLVAIYLIIAGLDFIFSWQQKHPKIYKYGTFAYCGVVIILFIITLVW